MDIGRELRAARPRPTDEFQARLVDTVRAEQPRRRIASRPALALAMIVVGVGVAASFGGVSEAARNVGHAVDAIIHVGSSKPPAPKPHASPPGGQGHQPATPNPGAIYSG